MSRIGKQFIQLPNGVTLNLQPTQVEIQGSKGTLTVPLLAGIGLKQEGDSLQVERKAAEESAAQGLLRTLLQNAVTGVSTGWQKELELHGVGMRAVVNGNALTLSLGFSHPVQVEAPEGISFQVTKNVISVSGIDKQLVGETAAKIRKLRKPEPYKGKGIRYSGEMIRRKAGKTGKATK